MITLDNLQKVLENLGYKKEINEEKYIFHFEEFDCDIEVDFENKKINYPENKGLVVNERQTTNFSNDENFVVLECIHRLLLKGYKPSHIEVEKRWSLGHLQKSGRADICVMNETGDDVLFIIECKTYKEEFEKELKNLKSDGGQLFSYYQQEKSAKWLILYAVGFEEDKIFHQIKTIPVYDTEDKLEMYIKDKNTKLYENAKTKEKAFDVWQETYEKKIYDDLVFSKDTIAYNIGEKPLRKRDLKEFDPNDKIVNSFEEILRHNNVSDKENAFNKLTALFICKLVDEITKNEEDIVEFQYKYGTDTYETLLDRLQRLYKEGMDKFMKEEIFYLPSEYADNLFNSYKGANRKNAIKDLKENLKKLKYFSNSDFAFKEVYNETLFQQNGKILVEIIKLFQSYKIVYDSKHQFLGDLFEQLLNQGFKQNEGQFFTPIPITRFIWESLPLESILENIKGDKYPKVVDYACGSGHFLTEGIDIINSILNNSNNDWVKNKIYGIEKDYRLARVSKISLFMNGAGSGNIVFGDGLDNHKEMGIQNSTFDILVANPPYSVKAFKSHLKLKDNSFKLLDVISKEGSEIEVLFIERIVQLLRPKGVAAVILPSSILSNSSNSYIGAREILLKNFKIRAISQFADKTFGATGTNTVVLFLEKYDEPPKYFEMIEDNINSIFNNQSSSEWQDTEILNDYIEHLGVEKDRYLNFLKEDNHYEEFEKDEYLKIYIDSFNASTELKNLKDKKIFQTLSREEQNTRINSLFYNQVKEIEKDKMFYFALVREQNTLVIKVPSKNTEQTEFLGYTWSNRKGSEGIQIKNEGGKLYDPNDRNGKTYVAPLVRNSFNNDFTVEKELENYANVLETKNMLDFEREKFDKSISLVEQSNLIINSIYELKSLNEILETIGGLWTGKKEPFIQAYVLRGTNFTMSGRANYKDTAYINVEKKQFENRKLIKGDIIIEKSGGSAEQAVGRVIYFDKYDKNFSFSNFCARLRLKDNLKNKINTKYIFLILNNIYQSGNTFKYQTGSSGIKNLNLNKYLNIKIPVPPLDIQEKIISECEKLEEKYESTRMKIEDYQAQIQKIFEDLEVVKNDGGGGYKLSDSKIFTLSIGKRVLQKDLTKEGIPVYSANVFEPIGNIDKKIIEDFNHTYIVWGIDGDWMVNIFEKGYEFYPTDHCGYITVDEVKINPRYLAYLLDKEGTTIGFSRSYRASIDRIKNVNIFLPSIDVQNQEMKKVNEIEEKIKILKENQIDLSTEISKVINFYIN